MQCWKMKHAITVLYFLYISVHINRWTSSLNSLLLKYKSCSMTLYAFASNLLHNCDDLLILMGIYCRQNSYKSVSGRQVNHSSVALLSLSLLSHCKRSGQDSPCRQRESEMNTFSCWSLWGNGQQHESDSPTVMCCLADTCWGLSFPSKQSLVPPHEWMFWQVYLIVKLRLPLLIVKWHFEPLVQWYVKNECNKHRWYWRYWKSERRRQSEVIVPGAQWNTQLPPLCASVHPSVCLCCQSRVAVMHVDTVFLVCPLIFGE